MVNIMSKSRILVVWSNYYEELAQKQLASCLALLENSNYDFQVETVNAGTYEIPAVIRYYHLYQPFDGYIPLSLLLKGATDHYDAIWEHVKECFIQFTLQGIVLANSSIITAPSMELLIERVNKGERVQEAFAAVDYLIQLKNRMSAGHKQHV